MTRWTNTLKVAVPTHMGFTVSATVRIRTEGDETVVQMRKSETLSLDYTTPEEAIRQIREASEGMVDGLITTEGAPYEEDREVLVLSGWVPASEQVVAAVKESLQ